MATVEFLHIHKTYPDGTRALEDLNLKVAEGEMMVLVGPSGCGKSTSLRLLAGLEPVSAGELLIGGERVNERPPQQRDIAMVFQNYALYPHMTVRRNLAFPLQMLKLNRSEIAKRVEKTAQLLGLAELLERRPRQLSGGQRQRVAMGRAIVREPRVFLMDEPLSNLDATLRTRIRAEIADLQKRLGITTIYVTHDQVEAMTLGDRIALLNAGRLQQVGPPQELYEQPANAFVAAFLGNPGMNIFPARLSRASGVPQLESGGWRIPIEQLLFSKPGLEEFMERPILAGLRPEAFSTELKPVYPAIIESIESLGHERLVYFRPAATTPSAEQKTLVARLSYPHVEATGQHIKLGFKPEQLYFFTEEGSVIA
jgi:multiple sugar transport system ATP-binding protein